MQGIRSLSPSHDYYPAFIDLRGKSCVVVGGGKVAERKALSLLRCGARVRIISPVVTDIISREIKTGSLRHTKRAYRRGDLKGAFLVIAATSDALINRRISADSKCLMNVVDSPDAANFIVPSMIKRGPLTIAVSTSGASPAAARVIRKELEAMYGRDFGRFLDFLASLRKRYLVEVPDKKAREKFFRAAGSKETFDLLRSKGFAAARKMILDKLQNCL